MVFSNNDDDLTLAEAHQMLHRHGKGQTHTHDITRHEVGRGRAHKLQHGKKKKRRMQERSSRSGKPEIHSDKWHRCINHVQRRKGSEKYNAYAVCTNSIGKLGSFARGHGGLAKPKGGWGATTEAGCGTCAACKANKRKMREEARLDREHRQILREAALGSFEELPGTYLEETWSDAARAAALAARRAKSAGFKTVRKLRNKVFRATRVQKARDLRLTRAVRGLGNTLHRFGYRERHNVYA